MATQGILVNVYRWSFIDATNKGLSSKLDTLIMVDENGGNFDCPHTTEGDYLVLTKFEFRGKTSLRAIPKSILDSKRNNYMFGGNFVYSSDSRFPSDAPIKVFDRVEG